MRRRTFLSAGLGAVGPLLGAVRPVRPEISEITTLNPIDPPFPKLVGTIHEWANHELPPVERLEKITWFEDDWEED
jgi:hypothetical protein